MLFKITLLIWFILWAPLLVISLPSRWLCRKFIVMDAWGVLWIARLVAGIKYKIRYADGKSMRNKIVAAKHMSILEVAILTTHIHNVFFIIKRELMWIPIYGWAFARMGLQPVNRARGATNMNKLVAAVAKKIKSGMTLVIFPEGTRAKPGQPQKLKRGLLFIAEQLKLPIVPVGTDSGLYWPKKGKMQSGTANVYFEKELPFDASLDEISAGINKLETKK